jgi:hypothetical protein
MIFLDVPDDRREVCSTLHFTVDQLGGTSDLGAGPDLEAVGIWGSTHRADSSLSERLCMCWRKNIPATSLVYNGGCPGHTLQSRSVSSQYPNPLPSLFAWAAVGIIPPPGNSDAREDFQCRATQLSGLLTLRGTGSMRCPSTNVMVALSSGVRSPSINPFMNAVIRTIPLG